MKQIWLIFAWSMWRNQTCAEMPYHLMVDFSYLCSCSSRSTKHIQAPSNQVPFFSIGCKVAPSRKALAACNSIVCTLRWTILLFCRRRETCHDMSMKVLCCNQYNADRILRWFALVALVSVYWGMRYSYLGFGLMFQRSARAFCEFLAANWFDICRDWGSVQDGFFHEQGREAWDVSLFSFPGNASCCIVLLVITELYIMIALMFFSVVLMGCIVRGCAILCKFYRIVICIRISWVAPVCLHGRPLSSPGLGLCSLPIVVNN